MTRTRSSRRLRARHLIAFPLTCLVAAGIVVPWIWESESPLMVAIAGAVVVVCFLVVVHTLSWLLGMKSVKLDGDRLLVRGIFRSEVIDMSNVTNVFQNFGFPVKGVWPVVIHRVSPSRFGSHILFVPKWDAEERKKWVRGREWVEYAVVRELRGLSRRQTA